MRIRQNNAIFDKVNAWLQRDVKVNAVVRACTAITCIVALITGTAAYTTGIHSAAVKEAADTIKEDNADYSKMIDKYNGIADKYNAAKDAIAEADTLKSGIKDLNSQHDELQKKVDAKKAELQSLTGQVNQAKRNSVSDGVWQVGRDIDAGTYRATTEVGSRCYWSITVSGQSDNILQNDIPGGGYPQVTVSEGQQLKLMNCGTFTKQ